MTADELKEIEAILATCEFAYDPYNTQGDCLWIK